MSYRDELAAAHARADALEKERESLEKERDALERERDSLKTARAVAAGEPSRVVPAPAEEYTNAKGSLGSYGEPLFALFVSVAGILVLLGFFMSLSTC